MENLYRRMESEFSEKLQQYRSYNTLNKECEIRIFASVRERRFCDGSVVRKRKSFCIGRNFRLKLTRRWFNMPHRRYELQRKAGSRRRKSRKSSLAGGALKQFYFSWESGPRWNIYRCWGCRVQYDYSVIRHGYRQRYKINTQAAKSRTLRGKNN